MLDGFQVGAYLSDSEIDVNSQAIFAIRDRKPATFVVVDLEVSP